MISIKIKKANIFQLLLNSSKYTYQVNIHNYYIYIYMQVYFLNVSFPLKL
jgi:hypothetical protein